MAVNRYTLKWKTPAEAKGISEYKRDHPGKRSRPTVVLHTYKKCNREGGVGGAHMSKSQVQQNASETENSWKERKKRGHMKLYSYSSQALIRWQILFWMMAILPKRETKSRKGGRWRRGSCTLLYGGHRGKLQSSVSHLEYLTHCERQYFSLISRVFSGFLLPWPFWQKPPGTLGINFRNETGVKAAPFGGRRRSK